MLVVTHAQARRATISRRVLAVRDTTLYKYRRGTEREKYFPPLLTWANPTVELILCNHKTLPNLWVRTNRVGSGVTSGSWW